VSFRVSVWFMVSVMICRYSLCDHAHSARCQLQVELFIESRGVFYKCPVFRLLAGGLRAAARNKHIYVIHVRVEWAVGLGCDKPPNPELST